MLTHPLLFILLLTVSALGSLLLAKSLGWPWLLGWPLLFLTGLVLLSTLKRYQFSQHWLALVAFFFQASLLFEALTEAFAGFRLKSHILAMGLIGAYALWSLIKHRAYVLSSLPAQLLLGFAMVGFTYYLLGHSSDFYITTARVGYTSGFDSELGDFDSKFIVLVTAISLFLAFASGFMLFNRPKALTVPEANNRILHYCSWAAVIIALIGLGYSVGFGATLSDVGMSLYLPVYITLLIAFKAWLPQLPPIYFKGICLMPLLPKLYDFLTLFALMTVPIVMNKTSLAGLFIVMVFYAWCLQHGKLRFELPAQVWRLATQGITGQIVLAVGAVLFIILFYALGLNAVIDDRIDYFVSGFTRGLEGQGTVGIRIDNLKLLFAEWNDNLSWVNALFGHGLASSREAMFYLSASMRWAGGRLVQTAHNSYIEFIYDFGLTSLLYFGTYITLIKTYWDAVVSTTLPEVPRYFVASGLALILFVAIYGMTDGIKVPFQITQFGIHGFIIGLVLYFQMALPSVSTSAICRR